MGDQVPDGRRPASGRTIGWWVLTSLLWAQYALIAAYQITPSSVLSVAAADLGVGPAGAGAIVSVLFVGMAVFAVPAGLVIDRIDAVRALPWIAVGLLGVGVVGWYAGVTENFWLLVTVRVLGGGLAVTNWTATVDLVSSRVVASRQGTAIGLLATAIPVGLALGQATMPPITASFGWEATLFVFVGGSGGLIAGIWAVGAVRRRSSAAASTPTSSATPTWADFATVFRSRGVWTVSMLAFSGMSILFFVNNWMPSYLTDRFSLTLAEGGLLTAVFPAIGALARGASGGVSDRLFGQRRRPIVLLSFLVTAPSIFGFLVANSVAAAAGLLIVGGFFSQMGTVILFTYVRELVEPNVAATALAVLNALAFIGAFTTPLLAGALIERAGYTPAFLYAGLLAVASVGLAWHAPAVR